MVLHLLDLLKCHLVLAIKDKSVNDLLGKESKEIRKLLINLIDLPLSPRMHKVRIATAILKYLARIKVLGLM